MKSTLTSGMAIRAYYGRDELADRYAVRILKELCEMAPTQPPTETQTSRPIPHHGWMPEGSTFFITINCTPEATT